MFQINKCDLLRGFLTLFCGFSETKMETTLEHDYAFSGEVVSKGIDFEVSW